MNSPTESLAVESRQNMLLLADSIFVCDVWLTTHNVVGLVVHQNYYDNDPQSSHTNLLILITTVTFEVWSAAVPRSWLVVNKL